MKRIVRFSLLVVLMVTGCGGVVAPQGYGGNPCGGDPCCGDPCCGDPCCGDPCCGDPCCGDPCCGDPCCGSCAKVPTSPDGGLLNRTRWDQQSSSSGGAGPSRQSRVGGESRRVTPEPATTAPASETPR